MNYSTASTSTSASVSFVTPTYPVEVEVEEDSPTRRLCLCSKSMQEKITVDDDYVTLIQLEESTTTQMKISIDDFPALPFVVDRSIDDDDDNNASSIHRQDTFLISKAPTPLSHNEVNRRNEDRRNTRAALLSSGSKKRTKLSKKFLCRSDMMRTYHIRRRSDVNLLQDVHR